MSTLALNANDARARSVVEQHERGIGLDGGGQSRLPSRGVGFFVHGATGRLARQATRTCGWSAPSPLLGDLRPNVHARDQPCTNRVDVLDVLVRDTLPSRSRTTWCTSTTIRPCSSSENAWGSTRGSPLELPRPVLTDLRATVQPSAVDRVGPVDFRVDARERRVEVAGIEGRVGRADQVVSSRHL